MTNKVNIIGKNIESTRVILGEIIFDLEKKLGISMDTTITVRLHNGRESYDKQLGRETLDWEVGNTSTNNEIDIIHEDFFEKCTSHSIEEFPKILKHEISHIYINKITKGKMAPMWLNEGLAMYLADQMPKYRDNGFYIEEKFLPKISTEYGWNKYSNYSAYNYSCLFTEFLINKYSLEKLLELLRDLRSTFSLNTFSELFEKIFCEKLENIENDFIRSLK